MELKWKCAQRRQILDEMNLFEKISAPAPIATIIAKIEQLAAKDKLIILKKSLKDEYKEIFEPIPHANLLPDEYTARISLKDAEKTILS